MARKDSGSSDRPPGNPGNGDGGTGSDGPDDSSTPSNHNPRGQSGDDAEHGLGGGEGDEGDGASSDPGFSADLSRLLADWPYESGKIAARFIMGDDNEPRLQIRLDLGLLQMQLDGRPDGQRPRGFESMLEYQEARLDEASAAGEDGFELSADDCRELREEAVQYYQRYTGLLVLEDFDGVVRDTTRNLRLLDFCKKHAASEEDREALEQFRPFIMMTRARALASQAMKDNEPKAALLAVEEGLEALRRHFDDIGQGSLFEQSSEARMLRRMRDELLPQQPVSKRDQLKKRLAEAISTERYEQAAKLRDELKNLTE